MLHDVARESRACLIDRIPRIGQQHDVSGLYANVQLPVFYGELLHKNSDARNQPRRAAFLARARKQAPLEPLIAV